MRNFDESLAMGQAGESLISRWLRKKHGFSVLPVYEKIIDTGKGPHLFTPDSSLVAPDLLVFKGQHAIWIEAKHKEAFSWYRIGNRFVTGIDLRHYLQYQEVENNSPWPVWLLFLHRGGRAKDTPPHIPDSPAGLFGQTLSNLVECESHRSDKWAKGMVYWAHNDLKLFAHLEDVLAA